MSTFTVTGPPELSHGQCVLRVEQGSITLPYTGPVPLAGARLSMVGTDGFLIWVGPPGSTPPVITYADGSGGAPLAVFTPN